MNRRGSATRWLMRRPPTHFAYGIDRAVSSACGIAGLWHRGLKYTKDPARVTCKHCLRVTARQASELVKNVTGTA
jgi:hypothetical protein